MVPSAGDRDHVTAVLPVFVTTALNACVCDGQSDTSAGVTLTRIDGESVTVAVADFVASATLAAFTVTVCWAATLAGAVYNPVLEIAPVFGFTDHVTALLEVFVTVAENCCVCDP